MTATAPFEDEAPALATALASWGLLGENTPDAVNSALFLSDLASQFINCRTTFNDNNRNWKTATVVVGGSLLTDLVKCYASISHAGRAFDFWLFGQQLLPCLWV